MIEIVRKDRPLPTDRAFVVQMHVEADVARGHVMGRAEHVVSGQATHFNNLEELLVFIDRVLKARHAGPTTEVLEDA